MAWGFTSLVTSWGFTGAGLTVGTALSLGFSGAGLTVGTALLGFTGAGLTVGTALSRSFTGAGHSGASWSLVGSVSAFFRAESWCLASLGQIHWGIHCVESSGTWCAPWTWGVTLCRNPKKLTFHP